MERMTSYASFAVFLAYVLAVAVAMIGWSQAVAAGELRAEDLDCVTEDGELVPVVQEHWSDSEKAFGPDFGNHMIISYPDVANYLPEAVVKLDFASACLQIINRPSDVCSSVEYLRFHGAISRSDVDQLERHYLSLGKKDPTAFLALKEVFACY